MDDAASQVAPEQIATQYEGSPLQSLVGQRSTMLLQAYHTLAKWLEDK
jgi:hypothetical protein